MIVPQSEASTVSMDFGLMNELDRLIKKKHANFSHLSDYIPLDILLRPPGSGNGSMDQNLNLHSKGLRSTPELVALMVSYSIIILCSLFGNVMVCHVIYKNKRLHTVTNMFIVNLAVSDLSITTLNIPFNIARNVMEQWVFGGFMCHLVNFVLMTSVYASTFTMTAIAIDRYVVILYPLRPRMTFMIGSVVVVITWLTGAFMSIPFAIYAEVGDVHLIFRTVKRCRLSYPTPSDAHERGITLFTVVCQYVIPMIIIAVAYGQIVRTLWIRKVVGQQTENQQRGHDKAKRKTIKMLIIVVVIFGLCWLPLNLYHVLTDFHPDASSFAYNSSVYLTCHWLAMSSVCYNPFIYCWLNDSFRSEVRAMCTCLYRQRGRIHPGLEVEGVLIRADRVGKLRRPGSSTSASKAPFRMDKGSKYVPDDDPAAGTQRLVGGAEHLANACVVFKKSGTTCFLTSDAVSVCQGQGFHSI